MVTDVSENRLTILFTEPLTEPLRGWVKAYQPLTLQHAISRARDLRDSVPKNKFPLKTNFLVRDKDKKRFQQDVPKKTWLDEDTRKDLRRKKLCFTCQEPGYQDTGVQGRRRSTTLRCIQTVMRTTMSRRPQKRIHTRVIHQRESLLHYLEYQDSILSGSGE